MSEMEDLKQLVEQLEKENKELKQKYENYRTRVCMNNVKKVTQIYDLTKENEILRKELEKKYENCIMEKQQLKKEIEDLKKLLSGNTENVGTKRKRIECAC
jgi:predicted RNase H-like nuclease (RuvC/YqgF family)